MSWVDQIDFYQGIVESIEPSVTLRTKDHWIWPTTWWMMVVLVTVFTLGIGTYFFVKKMSKDRYLKEYATTFGPFHNYPKEFDALSRKLLVHECAHTKQSIFFGYFFPILGWIPGPVGRKIRAYAGLFWMALFYLVLPFPVWLCYGRYKMELMADQQSYRWSLANGVSVQTVKNRSLSFAEEVGGANYGFPWPIWLVRMGFRKVADKEVQIHFS